MTARVSVVVPTRDRPCLLGEALASIRALEGPDVSFEILVGDNGGLKETASVVQAFGARHIVVDRAGAGAARNVALEAATGEYVAFLDDDDLWLSEHLRPQLARLTADSDVDAVIGQVVMTDVDRCRFADPWPQSLPDDGDAFAALLGQYPQIGATVARIGVRETVGLFDETLLGDQDWDWHLRLALHHRIGFVPVVGVLFRQRPSGSFDDQEWQRLGYMNRVFFQNVFRSGRRRPSLAHIARLYGRHRGKYYHTFRASTACPFEVGERWAAWRSLGRALAARHPLLQVMHQGQGGWKRTFRGGEAYVSCAVRMCL